MTNPIIEAFKENGINLKKSFSLEEIREKGANLISYIKVEIDSVVFDIKVTQSADDGLCLHYEAPCVWSTSPILFRLDFDDNLEADWNRGSGGVNGKGLDFVRNDLVHSKFITFGLDFLVQLAEDGDFQEIFMANRENYVTYSRERRLIREQQEKEARAKAEADFEAKMAYRFADEKEATKLLRDMKKRFNENPTLEGVSEEFDIINRELDMDNISKIRICFRNDTYRYYDIVDGKETAPRYNSATKQKDVAEWIKRAVVMKG